jgi:anaerobic selenocysteine-containing dehydrogenase
VICRDGLVDHGYVDVYTVGYEDLEQRVQEYTPERVEQITGVPAQDVERLAREYATTQPSAIRIGVAIERHVGGGQTVRSIACLPALVGAWKHVGGGVLQLPLWAFPIRWDVLSKPEWIQPGTRVLNQFQLGPALNGDLGLDPPVMGLFVYNSNPVIVSTAQRRTLSGLEREDLFTVVSEQFMTDTARYADIVLPATTQLEQFDLMFSWGHLYLSLNLPAIEPLGEALPNVEQFRRLAQRMGYQDDWFRLSDEEMAEASMDWTQPTLQGITMERLKAEGWCRLNVPDPDNYAPHAQGAFPTPSGKVEFRSSMAENGNFVVPVFREMYDEHQPGDLVDPLPHYIGAPEDDDHPLYLLSPKSHAFLNSQYGNMRHQRRVQGEQSVLVHPADAAARGIADGHPVRVYNDHGQFHAAAVVTEDVAPGVAISPLGQWLAEGTGTVNTVTRQEFADLGNAPTFSDTRVEIAPA